VGDAWFIMGRCSQMANRPREAEESYRTAIRRFPAHIASYRNLATLLHEQGRTAEAMESWREGLRWVPQSPELHYGLGTALWAEGKRDEALEEFRAALRQQPDYAAAKSAVQRLLETPAPAGGGGG